MGYIVLPNESLHLIIFRVHSNEQNLTHLVYHQDLVPAVIMDANYSRSILKRKTIQR